MNRKPRLGKHAPNAIRVLLSVLLLGTAARASAQEPAAATPPGPRIALIDANMLFNESKLGKSYLAKIGQLNEKLRTLQQEKEAGAAQRNAELTTLREEAQKQSATQTAADRDAAGQRIRAKERELQAFIEDGRAEIEKMQESIQRETQTLHDEYKGKMRPHIEAVARQKGIDFLIDAAVTFQLNRAYDISRDVIAHADAAEPAGGTTP
jgi:Skp family chaperone for outer membrane proteins